MPQTAIYRLCYCVETQSGERTRLTQSDTAVLQEVAEVVEQGPLIVTADAAKITQEPTAVCHHLGKGDLLAEESARLRRNPGIQPN